MTNTTEPTRRGEINARLRELCAVRDVLRPDADDAVVMSELTIIEQQITAAKEMLWPSRS